MRLKNNERFDLSDRLIHFVRAVDLASSNAAPMPIDWPFGNIVETKRLSPFFLLRRILRSQQILPTWSIRNGYRTVYGPRPVVCFTEMPLAAFLEAGEKRSAQGEHMSPFGVVSNKDELFALGARPVISGLSENTLATTLDDGSRLLPEATLSSSEQYRYVAYDPTRNRPLDWTHEREWRWPTKENIPRTTTHVELSKHSLQLSQLQEIGFIVRTEDHARRLLHDILWLVDSEQLPEKLVHFLLVADRFPDPSKLVEPKSLFAAIKQSKISLAPFFTMDSITANELRRRFNELVQRVLPERTGVQGPQGELGACWLWLHDNRCDLVRALLSDEYRISINSNGRYLVNLFEYPDYYSLGIREQMTKHLAALVEQEFGVSGGYFSVLNSDDPDDVPFYTNTPFISDAYLNYAHNDEDF